MSRKTPAETRADDLRHFARMGCRVFQQVGRGPELLCVFVTSRCDAQCAHCFDWERRGPTVEADDLTREELSRVARQLPPLYFLLLAGGEPFLRPDLPEVAVEMASVARPRVLAVPTNGSQPEVIVPAVAELRRTLPRSVHLSINVSLDGVGALHDEIRGVPGLFDKAVRTVQELLDLAASDPGIAVGVVTVVSKYNHDHLRDVMEFVLDDLSVPIWAPFLTRGAPRDPQALEIDFDAYVEITRELGKRALGGQYKEYSGFLGAVMNNAKNQVRRETIQRTVAEGQRVVPCRAGRHSAVVWANGDVHPCELLGKSMGNLRDFDLDLRALWRSAAAEDARRVVDETPCACTHENTLTTSLAFDWRQWSAILQWSLAFAQNRHEQDATDHAWATPSGARRTDADRPEISFFIPALDEELLIGSTVRILDGVLRNITESYEIIVVDDGSTDGTSARVEELGLPNVRAIRCQTPSFRGNLARAMADGRGEFLFFMDADLTASERDIGKLVAALRSGADVAVGSRYKPGARALRMPGRLALSLGYNQFLRTVLGSPFLDHQCGLKGFRHEALVTLLESMPGRPEDRRWFWDAELVIRAHFRGMRVEELPVVWVCRRDGRFGGTKQFAILPWVMRLRAELRRNDREH